MASVRFDVAAYPGAQAYKLLAGLVVPRPIALGTTVDAQGVVNAAPFSFFNVMGTEPPLAVLAPGDRDDGTPKDTDRKSTRLNSSHLGSSYAVFCLKKKHPNSRQYSVTVNIRELKHDL